MPLLPKGKKRGCIKKLFGPYLSIARLIAEDSTYFCWTVLFSANFLDLNGINSRMGA
jgi:hypothetical protein